METHKKKDTLLLLVNDNEIYNNIHDSLGNQFTYQRAHTGVEAFSKMTFNLPSLIIVDSNNANTNVFELLKTIRTGIKTKLIPFIIISSQDDPTDRIKSLQYGADAFLVYPFLSDELHALVSSILNRFKEFYLLSITDELTRLYNRREFINKFKQEIENKKHSASLSILDIDHFKKVNDIYGHQTGDVVLMELADHLKKNSSKHFFPARFGGEEFVILFPGLTADAAKKVMGKVSKEFSSTDFKYEKSTFNVTFSAGIAEFPSMGTTVSELLSRSDQALYAAKKDGRNLIYTFSPIMARNDKFWEFLKQKKDVYISDTSYDAFTNLPFLPQILDDIYNLNFDVKSIGVLIISMEPIIRLEEYKGFMNYSYALENIKRIITRSTELIFPSDNYIGISDFYTNEFIILFPSVVDFSFNLVKFKEICKDIGIIINDNLEYFPFEISYSSDVLQLNNNNPRNIYYDIQSMRKNTNPLSDKIRIYKAYQKSFESISKKLNIKELIKVHTHYNLNNGQPAYNSFVLTNKFEHLNLFGPIIDEKISSRKKLNCLIQHCLDSFSKKLKKPLLFPFLPKINFDYYLQSLSESFPKNDIIVMINEYYLQNNDLPIDPSFKDTIPHNISFGLDNCFIGNEILNILSKFNFEILSFSDNITRNLYMFKNRMKVINGLTIFLDQLAVPTMASNVQSEEELQIIHDLNITYASGSFVEKKSKEMRKKA